MLEVHWVRYRHTSTGCACICRHVGTRPSHAPRALPLLARSLSVELTFRVETRRRTSIDRAVLARLLVVALPFARIASVTRHWDDQVHVVLSLVGIFRVSKEGLGLDTHTSSTGIGNINLLFVRRTPCTLVCVSMKVLG